MYFTSLSVLTTLACAAFSNAVPVEGVEGLPVVGGLVGGLPLPSLPTLPIRRELVAGVVAGAVAEVGHEVTEVEAVAVGKLRLRDDPVDLPTIFYQLVADLTPVADELKVAVAVKADIDIDVVTGLLGKVKDIVGGALVEVQFIVDHPVAAVDAAVVPILASVISTILSLLFTVLALVVDTVDVALADKVLPLVAAIGDIVAHILGLVLILVPGLLAVILATLGDVVLVLYHLNLATVISILGLAAVA